MALSAATERRRCGHRSGGRATPKLGAYDHPVVLARAAPTVLGLITAAVVLAGTDPPARAQEPAPARLTAADLTVDGTIELTRAWRFHAGDDSGWANPSFDDADWATADPRLPPGGEARDGWRGSGWFRRHIRIEPDLWGKRLVLRLEAPGSAALFIDGRLMLELTATPDPGKATGDDAVEAKTTVVPSAPREHLLAVRHVWSGGSVDIHGVKGRGFRLAFEEPDLAATQHAGELARERRLVAIRVMLTALPLFLAALHLHLFWLFPKARENLFYALWMLAFAWVVVTDLSLTTSVGATWRFVAERFNGIGVAGVLFFSLLTYYAVRTNPFPRSWMVFCAGAAAIVGASAAWTSRMWAFFWYAYILAVTLDVARIEVRGRTVHREGAGVLLTAIGVQWLVIHIISLTSIRVLPEFLGVNAYFLVVAPFAVAMSLSLSRDFARTSVQLERRLEEVQALSSQVLNQEREKHEYELRQRLLEAENSRKSRELEDARTLQLSMLPAELPALPGVEVGAAMATATEVGGDYYDFRTLPDGRLMVAVGDATGHGAAAGIVVTAVKTLFSALDGQLELPSFMARCSELLRAMHTGSVHMCLGLARVSADGATVCSAGMPPLLVHRAASGTVEEVVLSGLPLGSRLTGTYEQRFIRLAPGDTLLLTTDGLSELLDPAGTQLGFDGAIAALRQAAGAPPGVLVERMMDAATAWRNDCEQTDDITVVAVRVSAPEAAGVRR